MDEQTMVNGLLGYCSIYYDIPVSHYKDDGMRYLLLTRGYNTYQIGWVEKDHQAEKIREILAPWGVTASIIDTEQI